MLATICLPCRIPRYRRFVSARRMAPKRSVNCRCKATVSLDLGLRRFHLDHALLKQAKRAGVSVDEGVKLTSLVRESSRLAFGDGSRRESSFRWRQAACRRGREKLLGRAPTRRRTRRRASIRLRWASKSNSVMCPACAAVSRFISLPVVMPDWCESMNLRLIWVFRSVDRGSGKPFRSRVCARIVLALIRPSMSFFETASQSASCARHGRFIFLRAVASATVFSWSETLLVLPSR